MADQALTPNAMAMAALSGDFSRESGCLTLFRQGPAASPRIDPDCALAIQQVMHDMRGDLVNLAVMAKLLLRGHYGHLSATVKKQIETLEKKANISAGLAESYCRLAVAADSGELHLDGELDLHHDVLLPVARELAPEMENKEITLKDFSTSETDVPLLVKGNRLLLQSVMRTVFQNAIKHSPRKGVITYGAGQRPGGELGIFVANSGAVVPEQLRQRIFEKFITIAPMDPSAAKGLGMGLFLARTIAQRHGGDIWYEAEPQGSKFVITLPASLEN